PDKGTSGTVRKYRRIRTMLAIVVLPAYKQCIFDIHRMFVSRQQRNLLEAVSRLAYCNPFLPDRVTSERAVLGAEFMEGEPVWSYRAERPGPRENVWRIYRRIEPLMGELRS